MKNEVVIKVEKLSKKYVIGKTNSYNTLRDKLVELPRKLFTKSKEPEFWALKNVSFEVNKGEVLGLIGKNGAGKSTLLKVLSRITEPTKGKITMKGRVASMLEVGTGFNPELTGRENIYLNGAIIGMRRKEIDKKFEQIVEFSGIGKFIDTPVKYYSSGMYVRLAFAVAAHLDSDILLVDEVLAVGDAEFQKKCLGKMSDMSKTGKTVVLVSHNMQSIKMLCDRTILLKNGVKIADGNTNKLIGQYMTTADVKKTFKPINIPELKLTLSKITLNPSKRGKVYPLEPLEINLELNAKKECRGIGLQIMISNEDTNGRVFSTNTKVTDNLDVTLKPGQNHVKLTIDNLSLCSGKYWLGLGIDIPFIHFIYLENELMSFNVEEITLPFTRILSLPAYGHVYLNHHWDIKS